MSKPHFLKCLSLSTTFAVLFLISCENPSSSDSTESFDGAWYLYKSTYVQDGQTVTDAYSTTTTEMVVVIEGDVGTIYYRFSNDSVCYESEPFVNGNGAEFFNAKIQDGMIACESTDFSEYWKKWEGSVLPWPDKTHINDC